MGAKGVARQGRYAFGLLLLLIVVGIWVASSELMKYIFSNDFSKPFFLTFFNTSMFGLYLLGFAFRQSWRDMWPTWPVLRHQFWEFLRPSKREPAAKAGGTKQDLHPLLASSDDMDHVASVLDDTSQHTPPADREGHVAHVHTRGGDRTQAQGGNGEGEVQGEAEGRMNMGEVMGTALGFCLLWFSANYLFNLALTLTKVSSVTILSSTSGFFTLLLQSAMGGKARDKVTILNLTLVAASVLGVALVSVSDAQGGGERTKKGHGGVETHTLVGDCIALTSSFLYGAYLVFLQLKIGSEDRLDMGMFFGFVGLFNVLLLWPFFLVLHWFGLEPFELPEGMTWLYLAVNAVVGTVLSDYLWLYSTLLTSPLIATLGLSLTTPLAILVDAFVATISFNAMFVAGTLLVFVAFIGINLTSHTPFVCWLLSLWEPICGERIAKLCFGSPEEEGTPSTENGDLKGEKECNGESVESVSGGNFSLHDDDVELGPVVSD
eukprot:comp5043_c0_seq1/m.1139 comp5043_c0_seq1/g.1139  ORF comp5043_c0_seq1/g.1139 comp5043_c0_seq1/m.1139 type:complete len:491 (-) comp5043_c0_seq1:10-1482(-)